jgi:hypothetical protein
MIWIFVLPLLALLAVLLGGRFWPEIRRGLRTARARISRKDPPNPIAEMVQFKLARRAEEAAAWTKEFESIPHVPASAELPYTCPCTACGRDWYSRDPVTNKRLRQHEAEKRLLQMIEDKRRKLEEDALQKEVDQMVQMQKEIANLYRDDGDGIRVVNAAGDVVYTYRRN